MTDEKKNAPSEFKGPKEVKKEDNPFDCAILIRTNKEMTAYDIVEDFEFEGETYTKQEGLFPNVVSMIAKDIERNHQAMMITQMVLENLLSRPLTIQGPAGPVQISFINLIASATSEAILQRQSKDRIIKDISGGIVN